VPISHLFAEGPFATAKSAFEITPTRSRAFCLSYCLSFRPLGLARVLRTRDHRRWPPVENFNHRHTRRCLGGRMQYPRASRP